MLSFRPHRHPTRCTRHHNWTTSSRIQRTGSRRFKPEGAQAETRSVFSTNVETRASRQVSRALRSDHDQIDASPVAFLLFSLGLPAQSNNPRNSTRLNTTYHSRGHNRRLGLGARPDPRSVASTKSTPIQETNDAPFSRRFFTSGTYVMRTA